MKKQLIIGVVPLALIWIGNMIMHNMIHPTIAPELVVQSVNCGDAEANTLRGYTGTL